MDGWSDRCINDAENRGAKPNLQLDLELCGETVRRRLRHNNFGGHPSKLGAADSRAANKADVTPAYGSDQTNVESDDRLAKLQYK